MSGAVAWLPQLETGLSVDDIVLKEGAYLVIAQQTSADTVRGDSETHVRIIADGELSLRQSLSVETTADANSFVHILGNAPDDVTITSNFVIRGGLTTEQQTQVIVGGQGAASLEVYPESGIAAQQTLHFLSLEIKQQASVIFHPSDSEGICGYALEIDDIASGYIDMETGAVLEVSCPSDITASSVTLANAAIDAVGTASSQYQIASQIQTPQLTITGNTNAGLLNLHNGASYDISIERTGSLLFQPATSNFTFAHIVVDGSMTASRPLHVECTSLNVGPSGSFQWSGSDDSFLECQKVVVEGTMSPGDSVAFGHGIKTLDVLSTGRMTFSPTSTLRSKSMYLGGTVNILGTISIEAYEEEDGVLTVGANGIISLTPQTSDQQQGLVSLQMFEISIDGKLSANFSVSIIGGRLSISGSLAASSNLDINVENATVGQTGDVSSSRLDINCKALTVNGQLVTDIRNITVDIFSIGSLGSVSISNLTASDFELIINGQLRGDVMDLVVLELMVGSGGLMSYTDLTLVGPKVTIDGAAGQSGDVSSSSLDITCTDLTVNGELVTEIRVITVKIFTIGPQGLVSIRNLTATDFELIVNGELRGDVMDLNVDELIVGLGGLMSLTDLTLVGPRVTIDGSLLGSILDIDSLLLTVGTSGEISSSSLYIDCRTIIIDGRLVTDIRKIVTQLTDSFTVGPVGFVSITNLTATDFFLTVNGELQGFIFNLSVIDFIVGSGGLVTLTDLTLVGQTVTVSGQVLGSVMDLDVTTFTIASGGTVGRDSITNVTAAVASSVTVDGQLLGAVMDISATTLTIGPVGVVSVSEGGHLSDEGPGMSNSS